MKIITAEDVQEYSRKGLKEIPAEANAIVTDLAREKMDALGMRLVSKPGAQGATSSASRPSVPADGPIAQKLSNPTLDKMPFKSVIRSGKKLVGTFIGTPHPVMTEFMGHTGFDFVCIDAEHNAISMETLQKMLQGIRATPTYGMIRIPTLSYEYVTGALDIGADALLIPQIRTMDDIRRLKDFCMYPPIGRRGCGPSRLWDYGDGIMQLGDGGDINQTTNIVVQLETVQAIENIDEIVQSDFIDMFFIGPGDLSMDMGIFGQFSNPKLTDVTMMLRRKTAAAGKKLGIFAGNFQAAQNWLTKGFDMVILNSELGLLSSAIRAEMPKLREAIGG